MCGIAGFSGIGNQEILQNMILAIKHRGPDAQIAHYKEGVGLAHARLSIIDLRPEGNQPMYLQNDNLGIVFNGEIYNFKEIKDNYLTHCSFRTETDTEVLLHLYKTKGKQMLNYINGMFSFAIYDFNTREMFLARDRMGKKPLYYFCKPGVSFVFASELKSILKHPEVTLSVNLDILNHYLTFDYTPSSASIINNVYKLEPGYAMLIIDNQVKEKYCYWEHSFIQQNISFNDACVKFENLMNEATKRRLMSDVPLGVFLSGGLDSSAVTYFAQKNSTSKIKTFSIGFEDKSYNESDYANQVAKHLGTEHYTEMLNAEISLNLFKEISNLLDEPFADASLIPTYFLSKFTKNYVTVALGGDGSDELLAGYPTFQSDFFKTPFQYFPNLVNSFILNFANFFLPVSDDNISFDFKLKQFLRGFSSEKNHIHQLWLGSFLPEEKKKLFNTDTNNKLSGNGLEFINTVYQKVDNLNSQFNKDTYYYYKTYLVDDILFKVDRASMYTALEVRAPFLDVNVIEFLNSLPEEYKRKGFEGKYILKKIMEPHLPHNIIYRPKKGFGIPLSNWIRKDLKNEIYDVLMTPDPFFNSDYIKQLFNNHLYHKQNNRKLIWNLYVLKKWLINLNYN